MTTSLLLDGFVTCCWRATSVWRASATPRISRRQSALAVKYHAAQDLALQRTIETVVRFCGTNIQILMPMALRAFSASALTWSIHLIHGGNRNRVAGAISGTIGLVVGVATLATGPAVPAYTLVGGLILIALWQVVLAFVVFRTNGPAAMSGSAVV